MLAFDCGTEVVESEVIGVDLKLRRSGWSKLN